MRQHHSDDNVLVNNERPAPTQGHFEIGYALTTLEDSFKELTSVVRQKPECGAVTVTRPPIFSRRKQNSSTEVNISCLAIQKILKCGETSLFLSGLVIVQYPVTYAQRRAYIDPDIEVKAVMIDTTNSSKLPLVTVGLLSTLALSPELDTSKPSYDDLPRTSLLDVITGITLATNNTVSAIR